MFVLAREAAAATATATATAATTTGTGTGTDTDTDTGTGTGTATATTAALTAQAAQSGSSTRQPRGAASRGAGRGGGLESFGALIPWGEMLWEARRGFGVYGGAGGGCCGRGGRVACRCDWGLGLGCSGGEGDGVNGKGDRRTSRFIGRGGRQLLLDALVCGVGRVVFPPFRAFEQNMCRRGN